jgi:hypothetical protein
VTNTETSLLPMPHSVSTLVYKYNPKGFWLIGIYIVGLVIFISHWLTLSTAQIGLIGIIFLAVPLYVRYGDNENVRMMIWDERKLIFSSNSIDFGDDHYPVSELETAAVYLESFNGFTYRALGPTMNNAALFVDKQVEGDNNKISFRHQGKVEDFTFYLANYAQFAMLKTVINDWSLAGINVVLKQAFDDEFIYSEMSRYNTAAGIV